MSAHFATPDVRCRAVADRAKTSLPRCARAEKRAAAAGACSRSTFLPLPTSRAPPPHVRPVCREGLGLAFEEGMGSVPGKGGGGPRGKGSSVRESDALQLQLSRHE